MDGRARLRAYLEQRREMGESEFVLDGMSVPDALAAIDKLRPANPSKSSRSNRVSTPQPAPPRPRSSSNHVVPHPAAPPVPSAPATTLTASRDIPPVATQQQAAASPSGMLDLKSRSANGIIIGGADGLNLEQNSYQDIATLAELARLVETCTLCKLHETAGCAVPGEGNPDADFMCIGEAPGANEDEIGHPFVGQAGELLTKILAAIDLTRDQVYITNVLKHRPPANRNPLPDEVAACKPYLIRQIQLVKPKVILALGTFAAQTLLETKTPIGKLRGAVHRYHGIPLVVTYHPAALLRNPTWKRPTWEDVKLARLILDSSK